jgi:hypothetical protein
MSKPWMVAMDKHFVKGYCYMENYCNEYKRRVSYIFAYMDGCRDGNVGFAKAEVRGGYFALNVTLCGVRRDTAERMEIYLLFDRTAGQQTYNMLPVGTAIVNCGKGSFKDIFNPSDIASSGYCFDEIKGIAVLAKNDTYYTCFSLWEADTIDPAKCVYLPKGFRRTENEYGDENQENSIQKNISECEVEESNLYENCEIDMIINDNQERASNKIDPNSSHSVNEDFINAFDDDYFYNCIEVTPERVRELVGEDGICDNSFVMHGFYTYRHLLFGKVAKNNSGVEYFIGVPGMYSNRERYLATMFGFGNFKKSHRSDYTNPYFGYWYMEI